MQPSAALTWEKSECLHTHCEPAGSAAVQLVVENLVCALIRVDVSCSVDSLYQVTWKCLNLFLREVACNIRLAIGVFR